MKRKQGISLIVLVIIIIVMIILAASVVLTLSNTGIINKANEAVDKTNLNEVQNLATLVWAEELVDGKRGDSLKTAVLEKMKDYTTKYDIIVTDAGVTVNKPRDYYDGVNVVATDSSYFEFEFDETTKTATLVDVKEEHAEWAYYNNNTTNTYYKYKYPVCIIDENNNRITEIVVPAKVTGEDGEEYIVTAIGISAFGHQGGYVTEPYSQITKVILPNTIEKIDEWAFANLTALTQVKLSSNLKNLENCSFGRCTELESITLPKSLEEIDGYAFSSSTGLKSLIYEGTIEEWGNVTIKRSWISPIYTITCSNGVVEIEE